MEPPLVLVCLANSSSNFETLSEATGFAVNVLAETQKEISNTFARPVEDRFAAVDWQKGPHGSPILNGVSAWFDCSLFNAVNAGDHLILVGKVEAFENTTHPGLGYVRGAYVTSAAEAEALNNNAHLRISALIAYQGKILLQSDENDQLVLPEVKVGKEGATSALRSLISVSGATAEPGFIYSVYDDEERETQHISFLCQASSEKTLQGSFIEITKENLSKITDQAVHTMLERFATESRMGNFGVYYGNQASGKVQPITTGGEA